MRRTIRWAGPVVPAALALVTPVQAANEAIAFAPPPAWAVQSEPVRSPADAAGLVYFERQDMLIHLDSRGQSLFQAYRVKLLHPQALELGNITLSWNPAAGSATVHTVAILRDGARINVLDGAKFEVLRREDQLEQAMLSGVLTAVLHVPDLRVGDELEVAFTLREADPTLAGAVAGLWGLAPTPLPGQYRMALSWEDGHEPLLRVSPALQPAVRPVPGGIEIALTNASSLAPPKDAPPRFGWQRVAEYSDYPTWNAVSAKFAPLYAAAARLAPGSPLLSEAARIATAHPDAPGRAAAALKLVQQQVRYVYVGLGAGNLTPAAADLSWQRRFADCKGKTALLLALLRELGIRAEPVLVNNGGNDDGLDQRLPNPGFFDHVLVRAEIDGQAQWLDGTLPPVAMPSTRPVADYRWVLPVAANGAALEQLPWQPDREPRLVSLYEIDARGGFEKPAKLVATTITRGLKGLSAYAQFSALTPDQLTAAFRNELTGGQFSAIDAVDWRYDTAARASILTITGYGPVDWELQQGGSRSLSLPGGGFNPPERRGRDARQDQTAPYYNEPDYTCYVTTVRLPEQTKDEEWSFNTLFDTVLFGRTFYRAMRRQDHTIRMIRGSRIEDREYSAATATRDNGRLANFDNSMAWITHTPGRKNALDTRKFPEVPTTWGIDWRKPGASCLAPDLARAGPAPAAR